MLSSTAVLFFLGPRAAAEVACALARFALTAPAAALTGGEMALSFSFSSDPLFSSLLSTQVEILCQFKCQNDIPI